MQISAIEVCLTHVGIESFEREIGGFGKLFASRMWGLNTYIRNSPSQKSLFASRMWGLNPDGNDRGRDSMVCLTHVGIE